MEVIITNTLTAITILSFIAFKHWKKEKVDMHFLITSVLSAMTLPKITICLFYAITNSSELLKMSEISQYLVLAAILMIYVSIIQITRDFKE